MKDELFKELVASLREGGAILRGETAPSRAFVVDAPDVKRIRAGYRLTQSEFAALLGHQRQNAPQLGAGPPGAGRSGACAAAGRRKTPASRLGRRPADPSEQGRMIEEAVQNRVRRLAASRRNE